MNTKTAKLSPTMRAAMWEMFGVGADPIRQIFGTWGNITGPTKRALIVRGLLERDGALQISGSGRAWVAEQIEAARVEALREHLSRETKISIPRGLEAMRMQARSGVILGFSFRTEDHDEAWEMDRRLDEMDVIAARMGFEAHTEALAMNQLSDWRTRSFTRPMSRAGGAATTVFGGSQFDAERVDNDHAEALAIDAEADAMWNAKNVVKIPQGASLEDVAKAMGLELATDDGHPADGHCGDWTCSACGASAETMESALVERCARLGHRHVPAGHPRPDLEAVAGATTCYLRGFAGTRVEFAEDGEWVPGTVTSMMYRGDGMVVRADDNPDSAIRAPFARLRFTAAAPAGLRKVVGADGVTRLLPANAVHDHSPAERSAHLLGFRADGNDLPNPCACTGFAHVAPCPATR